MSRIPKYGDEVMVPSEHEDGHWCNGIVNSVSGGKLLIAAPGHRYSNLVLSRVAKYRTEWCWPEDVNAAPTGSKPALLEDVQG